MKKITIGRGRYSLELLSPLAISIGAVLWLISHFLLSNLDPIDGNQYFFAVALVVSLVLIAVPQILSLFTRVLLLPIGDRYESVEDLVMLLLFILFYGLIADSFIQASVSKQKEAKSVAYVLLSSIVVVIALVVFAWIGLGLAITSNK